MLAFANHPLLHQVQLQQNRFSGVLPADLVNGSTPMSLLHVEKNPLLEGCFPSKASKVGSLSHKGTRIVVKSDCPAATVQNLAKSEL
mmetsp:Transcript_81363/g.178887  ORF Transcript_81363/g.178887 Transcript_81363/m.178887 type:complete len:87 (+) Transcript_81363:223-483(+)